MCGAVNDRLAASRRSQFAPRLLLVVFAFPCPVSFLQWFRIGFLGKIPTNSIDNCRRNDTERPRCPALPVADEAGHKRVQRSARRKPAPPGEAAAGHRKRIQGSNEKHRTVHELSAGTARINDHFPFISLFYRKPEKNATDRAVKFSLTTSYLGKTDI